MLALRLGKLHVERDVLRGLTAKEFRGWEMFENLYPMIGMERLDYNVAAVLQMLHNINRAKGQKALPLKDFVLKFGEQEEKPRQTSKQQFTMLEYLAHMHANEGQGPAKVVEFKYPDPAEHDAVEKARAALKLVEGS
jgi:hypothetical protein